MLLAFVVVFIVALAVAVDLEAFEAEELVALGDLDDDTDDNDDNEDDDDDEATARRVIFAISIYTCSERNK